MNNKAFTIMELLTVIIIMSVLMLMVFPSVNKLMKNNNNKKYKSYEDMMVEYVKVGENKNFPINLNEINGLLDIKRECVGYVDFIDNEYKSYIKCDDKYQSVGYDSNKLN